VLVRVGVTVGAREGVLVAVGNGACVGVAVGAGVEVSVAVTVGLGVDVPEMSVQLAPKRLFTFERNPQGTSSVDLTNIDGTDTMLNSLI